MEVIRNADLISAQIVNGGETFLSLVFGKFGMARIGGDEYYLITRAEKGILHYVYLNGEEFYNLRIALNKKKNISFKDISFTFTKKRRYLKIVINPLPQIVIEVNAEKFISMIWNIDTPPRLPAELIAALIDYRTKRKRKK